MRAKTSLQGILVATAGLTIVVACSADRPAPIYAESNVLLVTLDTLRADRLGTYGYLHGDTPHLDQLARDGIRFDQVISPMPMTLPAHTSLMTALEPYEHGVRDNSEFQLSPDLFMLAESFQKAGYETGAFVAAYVLHSHWGLNRGFDLYNDDGVHGVDDLGSGSKLERRGDKVVTDALPWLLQERNSPFFGWVHLYDPHAPYDAPEPWGTRFADEPYDGEVSFTDSVVGNLLEEIENAGLLENTIVVITADHGEDLQDHGELGHGLFIYDTTVRVPLLLRLPDLASAGMVIDEQIRLVDIAPTLLELSGLPLPENVTGRSVASFISGTGTARPAYSETMFPRWHLGWQELYALRDGGYKYILAPRPELYDVRSDPEELNNLAGDMPDVAAEMRERIESLGAQVDDSTRSVASGNVTKSLRALGYIGTAPSDLGTGPLPDPKDKVEVYAMMVEADSLMSELRYSEAITLLEKVIGLDPRLVDAHAELGKALALTDDYEGAEKGFLAALELRPDYVSVLAELGVVHRRLGQIDLARSDFEAVLELDPRNSNSLFNLGEMELEAGNPAAALRRFDLVIDFFDEPAAPHFAAGVASYELGDFRRAHEEFEFVATHAPDFAQTHYYRALLRESNGDLPGALAMYRQAIAIDPKDYRSLFNQAVILIDTNGDHTSGIQALRAAARANPELERALIYLGRSLVFVANPDNYPEAESVLLRGLELGPPPSLLPMAHSTLAELYRRTGRPIQANRHQVLADEAQRALGR